MFERWFITKTTADFGSTSRRVLVLPGPSRTS